MTAYGYCHECGKETGFYSETRGVWDCGCTSKTPKVNAEETRKAPRQEIAPKFLKLLRSGRWTLTIKTDGDGNPHAVGVRRKSTGEVRWFK